MKKKKKNVVNKEENISTKPENDEMPEDVGGVYKPGMPVMVKVDLETTFERGLICAILIAAFISLSILVIAYEDPKARGILMYFPVSAGLAVLAFYCRRNTDNHYIIDAVRKRIYFICNFFGKEYVSLFLRSEDILAFGVTGEKRSDKHSSWWTYWLVVVDKSGNITPLSNSLRTGRSGFNEKAAEYARIIGCDLAECPAEKGLRTRGAGDDLYEIYFEGNTFMELIAISGPVYRIVKGLLIGIALIFICIMIMSMLPRFF